MRIAVLRSLADPVARDILMVPGSSGFVQSLLRVLVEREPIMRYETMYFG